MKTRYKIILIGIIFITIIFIINSVIPGILYLQQDNLGLILYTCTLGIERYGPLMLISYNNGTHTINENSCVWIKNGVVDTITEPEPEQDDNSIPKWKIPQELSKIGCTDTMVDHLKKYSNAFDEKWYGQGVSIEDIGLPWGVHQYALDQCMQNISDLRDSELYGCEENEVYFRGICMTPETREKAQAIGEKENED